MPAGVFIVFFEGVLPPREQVVRLGACPHQWAYPAPTRGSFRFTTKGTKGVPGAAPPGPPWGALSSPQQRKRCSPQKDSPRERVGGGAGLCFPPRRIRDRAIKGRVVTKPSLYLKTNSCNEGQNFSIYIPFYKISFYKSWLLSLQKGCFLASLSHFWLQPSLQRTCNEHRIFCKLYEQIVARLRPIWFYTNQTKPRCPDFVAL